MAIIKEQQYAHEEELGELPQVSRLGYSFCGWFTQNGNSNGQWGEQIGSKTRVFDDATYYAKWQPITYDIIYDTNGFPGKLPEDLQEKYDITMGSYTPPAPRVPEGYQFFGWIPPYRPAHSTGDITFIIDWKGLNTYTVSWDSCGGSSVDNMNRYEGQEIGTLPTTVKDGYEFDGWYTAEIGGQKVFPTTKVLKNITYYAQWVDEIVDDDVLIEIIGGVENSILVDNSNIAFEILGNEAHDVNCKHLITVSGRQILDHRGRNIRILKRTQDDNLLINEFDEILSDQNGDGLVYVETEDDTSLLKNDLDELIRDEEGNFFKIP